MPTLTQQGFLRRAANDPHQATFVRIYRADSGGVNLEFAGKVTAWEPRNEGRIRFEARNDLRQVVKRLPGVQYQRYDNRHVYRSGIDELAWTTFGEATAVDTGGQWIEAAEFGAKATAEDDAAWFVFGTVRIVVEGREHVRLCRFHDGDRLYLSAPVPGLAVGQGVSASAGYDRSIFTRRDKFGDLANFVGFPWMPSRNLLLEPLEMPEEEGRKK